MEENKYYVPTIETWKDVVGYKGLYQVSNLGNVKSLSRVTNHGHKRQERILSLVNSSGYKYIDLCECGIRKKEAVHRLVATAFIQNPNNKPEVNHKDLNRGNNFVGNLEWVTRSENSLHASKNGALPDQWGENNPYSKLTTKEVRDIKNRIKEGQTVYYIHKKHYPHLHQQTLYGIKSNKRWKKVKA